jgi:hypothetical protein
MRVWRKCQLRFVNLALLAAVLPAWGFQPGQAVKVLASAEHEVGGVKVDLLEVTRDSPTVVTVRWRYRNETNEAKRLTSERTGWMDPYRLSVDSYLLDEARRIKYPLATDDDRRPVASRNGQPNQYISIRPKGTIQVWAKYIVPESTGSVTVAIDGIPPFGKIAIGK